MKSIKILIALMVLAFIVGCATGKGWEKCKYTWMEGTQKLSKTYCIPRCPDSPGWEKVGRCN